MNTPVKLTALTPDELARLLSRASRRAVSGQDVLAISESAGIFKNGTINLIEYTAFLARETAGGSD